MQTSAQKTTRALEESLMKPGLEKLDSMLLADLSGGNPDQPNQ